MTSAATEALEQWVIYQRPADFPDSSYVVRCWRVFLAPAKLRGAFELTPEVWLRETLPEARAVVAGNFPGGYRLDRSPADDPAIVEVWV